MCKNVEILMLNQRVRAMLMGELLTLKQHDLPVKTIVLKNDSLAFVELEMKAAGFVDFGDRPAQSRFHKDRRRSRGSRIKSGNSGAGRTNDCASSQT